MEVDLINARRIYAPLLILLLWSCKKCHMHVHGFIYDALSLCMCTDIFIFLVSLLRSLHENSIGTTASRNGQVPPLFFCFVHCTVCSIFIQQS